MDIRNLLRRLVISLVFLSAFGPTHLTAIDGSIEKGRFRFHYSDKGISSLANPDDPFRATVTAGDQILGLLVRYQTDGTEWKEFSSEPGRMSVTADAGTVKYVSTSAVPLRVTQTFRTDGKVMDWDIDLESTKSSVTVGDVAIQLPVVGPWSDSEDPSQIFERGFVRHGFNSGHGSFLYFVRASGAPPLLLVTVRHGTKLEYFSADHGNNLEYIHSGLSGSREKRGTWRQEHTFLKLGPAGSKSGKAHYGFRLQWADSYEGLRNLLYENGLFDIRAVPGMTIPLDLKAHLAVRTRARIESIDAEFPSQTRIVQLPDGESGYKRYEVTFSKLGENQLTIRHDGGRETYLEYFVTESLETLIRKRSAFLVNRQQIRDTSKWWDGVFAPYDMRNKVLRTPDDPDIFTGRMSYVLTCDDPGLSKAPFLALKNVSFPDQKEIESIEYYLQHFVWGKLQRTDAEIPYPYGVYGTPDWLTNRDPNRRASVSKTNLDKMHVWRSYDYPHIVMVYFHMYEIAKKYPQMSKYLDSAGYLDRAYNTARAFFTYPYEILSDYYETYKWGLYNELVVLKLADALDQEGFPDQASWLRAEWEKKVKYFVYDDEYPFRSEYAFDRTAFESTYAFAKYGTTHDMKADQHLWWDIRHKKWYSHPQVRREDSRQFMDRQLAAGLTVRGWLEPSFYQLGSDPGLSYMAAMGGWGILDYGINFAERPYDWLQLGYASYLSSWSLVNSGPPETNYGFWFPGKENDGAAGWQFMSEKYGRAWMGTDAPRGPWHYDGEIDLGFAGALRTAATVLTCDPVFDWIAYGGELSIRENAVSVVPRDGLRQRFVAVIPDARMPWSSARRFKIEVDRDGFACEQAITTDKRLDKVSLTIENRTKDTHVTAVSLSFPIGEEYEVRQEGKRLTLVKSNEWDYPWRVQVSVPNNGTRLELVRIR